MKTVNVENEVVIFTIGHSTLPIDEFIGLLLPHGVSRLVDVRTVPRSRHNPQFNRDTLPEHSPRKASVTLICRDWAVSVTPGQIRRTEDGATTHFEVSRITCRARVC